VIFVLFVVKIRYL